MSNFNGYSLFNEIRNVTLRAYNRANTYINIKERHGPVVGMRYLKKLDRANKIEVYKVMQAVHRQGFEQTRRNILRTGAL